MNNEQLKIDLRIQDEQEFDGEINKLTAETAQSRIASGTLARSKHEAYGIVSENLAQIQMTVKTLKADTGQLLSALPQDVNGGRIVEQISSIYSTSSRLARESVILSALCRRIIDDIYSIESADTLPLEEYSNLEDAEFEDAYETKDIESED